MSHALRRAVSSLIRPEGPVAAGDRSGVLRQAGFFYLPKGPELARNCLRTLPGIQRLAKAIRLDVAPTK